jgi:hypothetical protein
LPKPFDNRDEFREIHSKRFGVTRGLISAEFHSLSGDSDMARTRQIRWLACATIIAALGWSALGISAQDAEQANDESAPPRTPVRRSRGGVGGFPGRSAVESERPNPDESNRSPAVNDRDRVDTSRNQNLVYRANNTPAQTLSNALERHYRGIPGLTLVPESSSNSLLISAPPERLKEVIETLHKIDRAPMSATIEVTILEFPDVDPGKEISVREFLGPSEKVRAKVNELKKSGQVQRARRFRLTALGNQIATLQANGDRSGGAAGAQFPAGLLGAGGAMAPGRQANAARFPTVGTNIQCTARISGDKGVLVELTVYDAPANPDAQQMPEGMTSQFNGTVSIPSASTMVASEIATETTTGPARVVILVSADVIEPPEEKPLAGAAR